MCNVRTLVAVRSYSRRVLKKLICKKFEPQSAVHSNILFLCLVSLGEMG